MTRKERGKQLANVKDKADKLLAARNALHPQVAQSLDVTSHGSLQNKIWEEFDVFDEAAPKISEDDCISNCVTAVPDVMTACSGELSQLEGTKRTSDNPARDQLISDLADLYETESGLDQAANYRSPTAEDGYEGGLFLLTISLLNAYAPRSLNRSGFIGDL